MVKKARPIVKVTKATKATKARQVQKSGKKKLEVKPKPPSMRKIIFNSITDTLEHNTLGDGEFDLPSILTRYLEKSDPRSKLGLHREYRIPISGNAPYLRKGEPGLRIVLQNQASIIMTALIGEGILVRKHEFNLPLCKEHR